MTSQLPPKTADVDPGPPRPPTPREGPRVGVDAARISEYSRHSLQCAGPDRETPQPAWRSGGRIEQACDQFMRRWAP